MIKDFFLCSFFTVLIMLGFGGEVCAFEHTGEKAPGWELASEDRITYFEAVDATLYRTETVQVPDEIENQKIINSWGYKARNVDEIKDLLPGPFYNILKHPEIWGEFRINETAYIPNKGIRYKQYKEATEKYKGTCSVDEEGWLLNYKAGCPFPGSGPV